MKVILLEKIRNLGNLGQEIPVKPGFARNYLFPQYKAVLANKKNRSFFEKKIMEIEKKNNIDALELEKKKLLLEGTQLEIKAKSSEKGKLFGSITSKNICQLLEKKNIIIEKNDVQIDNIINEVGEHRITINLKNNVKVDINLLVTREE
jgi:large subunit ribosomal protein L9